MSTSEIVMGHRQILAISSIGALAYLTQNALPYEVAALASEYGLGPTVAGLLVSFEAVTMAITVTILGRSIGRFDKRRLCMAGVAIAIIASMLMFAFADIPMIVAMRGLFGIGLGAIAAATNALPAYHKKPEHLFAYIQVATGIVFIALMFVVPFVEARMGRTGLFATELGFLLILGPLALLVPRAAIHVAPDARSSADRAPLPRFAIPFLLGLGLLFVGGAAIWSFAQQAGEQVHATSDVIANDFTLSALANIFGPLAAALIGVRFGLRLPIIIAGAMLMASALLVYGGISIFAFSIGVILFSPIFSFMIPYMQALLAETDESGRSASLSGAAIMFGAAIGPTVAGLLSVLDNLAMLGIVTAGILFASVTIVLVTDYRRQSARVAPA